MRYVCPECGETAPAPGACVRDGATLASTGDAFVGRTVGSYRVARKIGEGGMGRVYLAVHPNIGARVAIKVLATERAQDVDTLERFFAEARVVNLIRHEHIVNVVDMLVLPDGPPCIVMEHLDGQPLARILSARAPLPAREIVPLALEVLAALSATHAKGIVHRDLKPENIFVTPAGHAKVLDFGIAKLLFAPLGSGPTRAGEFLGTPAYLAPEQVREARAIDGRADIYSLGVVLFEALTGRTPFASASTFDVLRGHVDTPAPMLRSIAPNVPAAVERVVLRALAKDPDARYANAEDMARALRSAAAEAPPDDDAVPSTVPVPQTSLQTVPPARTHATTPRPSRKSAIRIASVALTGLACVVALLVVGSHQRIVARAMSPSVVPEEEPPEPAAFDVSAFLPSAEARARKALPGAELVSLKATPVHPDGRVDVRETTRGTEAMYRFRARKDGENAVVIVDVTAGVVRVLVAGGTDDPKGMSRPTCTVRDVIARAKVHATAFDVAFVQTKFQDAPFWFVTGVPEGGGATVPDDCR